MTDHADAPRPIAEEDATPVDPPIDHDGERQLARWGGAAGLSGVVLLLGSVIVVGTQGLPDASDVETLTDFADIESGRIAEHLLYLGALVLFALHVAVLHRLLRRAHPAAALFGLVVASFGYVILAASSMLHVSTAPLADLYTAPDASPADQRAVEYAWHGAQSVWDTMLVTGALLVPIGIALLGLAMLRAPAFGTPIAVTAIGLGVVGALGATIEVIDPSSDLAAVGVLAFVVFHLVAGRRTLQLGRSGRPTG